MYSFKKQPPSPNKQANQKKYYLNRKIHQRFMPSFLPTLIPPPMNLTPIDNARPHYTESRLAGNLSPPNFSSPSSAHTEPTSNRIHIPRPPTTTPIFVSPSYPNPPHPYLSNESQKNPSLVTHIKQKAPARKRKRKMAQGAPKKASKPHTSSTTKHKKGNNPNHRARVIKPKKANLITQQSIKKKATSGLAGKTERMLAEKAGHLEMLEGGKRDKRIGGGGIKDRKSANSGGGA
ncbi:unnamed protein product [Periconia digitata]|uniref:Uncharacterized protein n=1 Tax=Periconia digitata TaxID=1303443 RepID=A0A9W4UKI5_9PLEO|nr:unnamed protein product [Periconia digitata]